MNQSAEAKLHELRSKTTRQLVSLISNKLDRGLAFARVLESDGRDWSPTEYFATNAEKAFADASIWMALLNGATPLEQRRLEFKLAELRHALDRARVSTMSAQAAC
jgi:hypothetical protein